MNNSKKRRDVVVIFTIMNQKFTNQFYCLSVFRCRRLARFWCIMVKIATTSIVLSELIYYIWIGMKNIYNFCKDLKNGNIEMKAFFNIKKNTPPASPYSSHSSEDGVGEVLNLRKMKDSPVWIKNLFFHILYAMNDQMRCWGNEIIVHSWLIFAKDSLFS